MSEEEIAGLFGGLFGCGIMLAVVAFAVLVWWKIFSKAGYPGALGLLMLVPLVNLGMMAFLAFARWPIQEELERHRGTPQSY